MTSAKRLAVGSIIVSLAVLGLKSLAYWLTGSIALYSDALESVINVAAATAALIAIRLAERPADRNHPYGHHKAEYFSAVLEGVLIIIAAGEILRSAYVGFLAPQPIVPSVEGLVVNLAAAALNGGWAWLLLSEGRKRRSPALLADARHLLADVVSSVGVLAGVVLALATGWYALDPALAALVALNILWSGWSLVKSSVDGLMDAAPPEDEVERIRQTISQAGEGALEAHDLRVRHAGRATFIEFHLVVPGALRVSEAHDICDRIEARLKAEIEGATVTIHVEPDEKAKHSGIVVL